MKTASVLPFAFLLAGTSLFGQSLLVTRSLDAATCPAGLEVVQQGSLFVYKNASSGPAGAADQRTSRRFQIKLTNDQPRDIASVQITARGYSQKWRVLSAPDPTPDIARTVHITLKVKSHGSATREVLLRQFPSARSFDLNAVTYADGSTWHAASPGACSVAPDPAVLIAAQSN